MQCVCLCVYVSYQATVTGVLSRVDNTELVQHLTHDDDTHPDCRQTGSHGPEATVGHRQRPQHHKDQVHHGWLRTNTQTGQHLSHNESIQKLTCLRALCQVWCMTRSFITQVSNKTSCSKRGCTTVLLCSKLVPYSFQAKLLVQHICPKKSSGFRSFGLTTQPLESFCGWPLSDSTCLVERSSFKLVICVYRSVHYSLERHCSPPTAAVIIQL